MTAQHGAPEGQTQDQTLGALVHQLTQQVPELIRSEMRLAQAEVAQKGKRAGVGIGMFSVAGLLAFFAFGSLVATAILALTLVVDAWLAALIVALVLLAGAAVAGLVGKNKVAEAGPPAPERAIQGKRIRGEGSSRGRSVGTADAGRADQGPQVRQHRREARSGVAFVAGQVDPQPDFGVVDAVDTPYAGDGGATGAGCADGGRVGAVFAEVAPVSTGAPGGVPVGA